MSGATTPADDTTTAPTGAVADSGAAPAPAAAELAVAAPTETATETGVALHTETATLLEGASAEAPTQADQPPGTPPAAETPPAPEPPKYEVFTLPDGVTVEPERITAYTETLGKHGVSQEAGQALIEMHAAEMQRYADHMAAEQHRVFADTRKGWRDTVLADQEIGGAGHQTAMAAVARMRDMLVPEQHRAAFNEMLRVTGVGDHPEFLRLLHNAARTFDEPAIPPAPHRPPPNIGQPPRGGRGVVYDHPSSQRLAGSNR